MVVIQGCVGLAIVRGLNHSMSEGRGYGNETPYNVLYLNLVLPEEEPTLVWALEVGLALNGAIVLALWLRQLHPDPLPGSKHGRSYIPGVGGAERWTHYCIRA